MTAPRIHEPNGNAWLTGVTALSSNDVWTVGVSATSTLTEHWNGNRWSAVSSPSPSPVNWHARPPEGQNFLYDVGGSSSSEVWAVGDFSFTFGRSKALIEHWNGTSWTLTHLANSHVDSQGLDSVSSLSGNDVWAVGYETVGTAASLRSKPLIEHWNGTRWSILPSPEARHGQSVLTGLGGVAAISTDNVWALGSASNINGLPLPAAHPVIIHWDGQSWRRSETPVTRSSMSDLSEIAGTRSSLWAIGFSGVKGEQKALIEHRVGC